MRCNLGLRRRKRLENWSGPLSRAKVPAMAWGTTNQSIARRAACSLGRLKSGISLATMTQIVVRPITLQSRYLSLRMCKAESCGACVPGWVEAIGVQPEYTGRLQAELSFY